MSKMKLSDFFSNEFAKLQIEGFSERDLIEIYEFSENEYQCNNDFFCDSSLVALF